MQPHFKHKKMQVLLLLDGRLNPSPLGASKTCSNGIIDFKLLTRMQDLQDLLRPGSTKLQPLELFHQMQQVGMTLDDFFFCSSPQCMCKFTRS
jgi:hypothetical protein